MYFDHGIYVLLAQIPQLVVYGEVRQPYVHLVDDPGYVLRKLLHDHLVCYLVEDLEHVRGRVYEPLRQHRLVHQMVETYLKRRFVSRAHVTDTLLECVGGRGQEVRYGEVTNSEKGEREGGVWWEGERGELSPHDPPGAGCGRHHWCRT